MTKRTMFTSESVTEGHPDKMSDQVSDAIVDAYLANDKKPDQVRVAVETLFKTGLCIVAGEVRTSKSLKGSIDIPSIVRKTINDIGYDHSDKGFDGHTCAVMNAIEGQSEHIAMGVDKKGKKEQGAGDQGLMFGYACNETSSLMPMPIAYAHKLTQALAKARKSKRLEWARPDGKSQVTVAYEDGKPVGIDAIVISTQHAEGITNKTIREGVMEEVIKKAIPERLLSKKTKFHINPTGKFVIGGPMGDAGITGRKIIVDTYGGMGRHGGGAFSGKDPSKVDRSAAYMARYVAKNIVAAKIASKCEIQLAYAIGVAQPVSVHVEMFGTGLVEQDKVERAVRRLFPLTPGGLIKHLKLVRPVYRQTAAYGHFGRSGAAFTWEKTDMVAKLKSELKLNKSVKNGVAKKAKKSPVRKAKKTARA